jgi:hypothetical protein
MNMIPAGYMAKRVAQRPGWIEALHVSDIFSVSGCVSENFTDDIHYWKHNGYWLFNSPEIIRSIARENSLTLEGTSLFYYEVYEREFDGQEWRARGPEASFATDVLAPSDKQLEGFDVVTFFAGTSPECSPLSCNGLAKEVHANAHCLFDTFAEAESSLASSAFKNSEPGPYRIFAVYSLDWF